MNREAIREELAALCGQEQIRLEEPMKRHTTFQVGGPAAFFVTPQTEEECRAVIGFCRRESVPYYVLGNGSNLLVSDAGYEGVMLSVLGLNRIEGEGEQLVAGAGVRLSALAAEAQRRGLTGLEFAAGIPGSVGGAAYMNAGAYDGEMAQVVERVRVLDETGVIRELDGEEMAYSYRKSMAMEKELLILSVTLRLREGERDDIRARMEELSRRRREKQPLEYPSAGSTFKRPQGYFAGKLIMDSGLAGARVGGACVSPKHCGFIVNDAQATADDVFSLCQRVRAVVHEKFGVELALEVKTIGFSEGGLSVEKIGDKQHC